MVAEIELQTRSISLCRYTCVHVCVCIYILCSAELLSIMTAVLRPLIALTHWINRPFERHCRRGDSSTAQEISALAALARSSRQITKRQEQIINAVLAKIDK